MPDTEVALRRLLDEATIRDATARFADTVTRADIEGFRALWADDAEWVIGAPFEQRAEGVDDIVSMLQNLWAGNDYFVQFAVQGPIEIDGSGRRGKDANVSSDRLRRCGSAWRS